jgi:hypothetical protein
MIAIGGLPARPACARQAATLLAGTVLDDAACARAGEMAAGEVAWQTASARASASGSAPHVAAPVTIRFPPLPPQLETLFSEASEIALVSCFTADMLQEDRIGVPSGVVFSDCLHLRGNVTLVKAKRNNQIIPPPFLASWLRNPYVIAS